MSEMVLCASGFENDSDCPTSAEAGGEGEGVAGGCGRKYYVRHEDDA
jgi:hypothetical protein